MTAEVRDIQDNLILLGYPLPRFGADGALGAETLAAVRLFERDHYRDRHSTSPGEISTETRDLLAQLVLPSPDTPPGYRDLTRERGSLAQLRRRPWWQITGITLHQTATVLGDRPGRWLSIPAHLGITRERGEILLINPLNCIVYHGNGFNRGDVGIEIDGHFEGIEGEISTYWRPKGSERVPILPSPAQLMAARQAVQWICAEVARHGGKVSYIHAHRQSSRDRPSDPGSRIWREVGVWAQETLGLSDGGEGYKVGSGQSIPREWDGRRRARY